MVLSYEEYFSNVSRETFLKLEEYIKLLLEYNQKFNLIGKNTEIDIKIRHIIDSAQLMEYIDIDDIIYDFGSGAGLPGIILSLLGVREVHLVESDSRKANFLNIASKISENKVIIHNSRIEKMIINQDSVILARALAPLDKLLNYLIKFTKNCNKFILPKGRSFNLEIEQAMRLFEFEYNIMPSKTSQESGIIIINKLKRKKTYAE